MLLASSIKDTLCDVQWIYCNKMFCYHSHDFSHCLQIGQTVLTLTLQVGERKTLTSKLFCPGSAQKAHKLDGEL